VLSGVLQINDKKIAEEVRHKIWVHKSKLQHHYFHHHLNSKKNHQDLSIGQKRTASLGSDIPFHSQVDEPEEKITYSFDDLDAVQINENTALKVDQNKEEKLCYICCASGPTAVLMPCGHGGICYECALMNWKNGDKCSMCRGEINEVLKVSVVDGVDVAKIILGTKKAEISDSNSSPY